MSDVRGVGERHPGEVKDEVATELFGAGRLKLDDDIFGAKGRAVFADDALVRGEIFEGDRDERVRRARAWSRRLERTPRRRRTRRPRTRRRRAMPWARACASAC